MTRLSRLGLRQLLLSDSLPISAELSLPCRVEPLAPLLGRAITRLHHDQPLAELTSRG